MGRLHSTLYPRIGAKKIPLTAVSGIMTLNYEKFFHVTFFEQISRA